jgi:3-hydroxyisobutyrate dehydrogenase-like beta-hydroxyacid dehydrogenase
VGDAGLRPEDARRRFQASFMVDHQQKDLRNVLDAAYSAQCAAGDGARACALQRAAVGRWRSRGQPCVIKVIEKPRASRLGHI